MYDEQSKAITQIERVLHTLSTPQAWGTFLRQYADLYAQSAITDLRSGNDQQALSLSQNFARVAGASELQQRFKLYTADIPTNDEDMPEDELEANRDLVARIEQIRKGL